MRDDDPEDGIRRGTAERQGLTRRRLVAAGAATWASVGLAGCDRIDDPGPPGGNGGDGDGSDGDGNDGDGNGGDGNGTTVSNRTTTTTGVGDGVDGTTPSNESTTTSPGDGGTTTTTEEPTTTTTEEPTTTDCASVRRFAAGMEIGLHVDVYDSETGEYLGDDGLDVVRVSFPDAPFDPLELSWEGPHEQYSSDGWGGKLTPDEDVESGTYRYEITVEGEGTGGETETVEDRFTIVN